MTRPIPADGEAMLTRRRTLGLLAAATIPPTAAFAPKAIAASLTDLIERHRLAIVSDRAAWETVSDLVDVLEEIEGREQPKVQVAANISWNGTERVKVPAYAYSEEELRRVILGHMDAQMAMAGRNEELREKIRTAYMAKIDAKLSDFRAQQAEYKRQEDEAGYTAALAGAKSSSAVVRSLEAEIIAFVPTTLQEAARKAAWVAWAYDDDYCYINDTAEGNGLLIEALQAIGRAAA